MFSISINRLFPFPRLIKFLLVLSILLQCIINSYSHFSGYYHVANCSEFINRLVYGAFLTTITSVLVAYPDLFFISYLNKKLPWGKKNYLRIPLQLVLTIFLSISVSTFFTLVANYFKAYKVDLLSVLIINALIFSILNIILMIFFEACILHFENRYSRKKAEDLEKEIAIIRFDVLKSQINPHFLFNSLNVLSSLINKDVTKAQLFIDEFSMIYRYVLETIEKQVVTLSDELSFVNSYIFLQKIRYGQCIDFQVNIPSVNLNKLLPPLSLQLVLENAIKHNEISPSKPLKIEINCDADFLVIKNVLQSKFSSGRSTGMGQRNLIKRYEMLHDHLPIFEVENNFYVAKLPIIYCDEI